MVKLVVNIMVIDNLDINCSCTCLITDIIGINIKDSGLVNSIQTFFCGFSNVCHFLVGCKMMAKQVLALGSHEDEN